MQDDVHHVSLLIVTMRMAASCKPTKRMELDMRAFVVPSGGVLDQDSKIASSLAGLYQSTG